MDHAEIMLDDLSCYGLFLQMSQWIICSPVGLSVHGVPSQSSQEQLKKLVAGF